MLQLEKYHGNKSRHTCPACHSPRSFVRYKNENGEYISSDVGRCNRESKCGYHKKPKDFFADNPHLSSGNFNTNGHTKTAQKQGISTHTLPNKNGLQAKYEASFSSQTYDFIEPDILLQTLGNYEQNAFVQFLINLFPDCLNEIQDVLKMYLVGTFQYYTCFPSLDRLNRICRAKLIRFNQKTGKRLKGEFDTSSLVRKLKLKEDFQYKQIFFGEHLLRLFPHKPVCIVEAEKTAIIASLCFPEFVWLGGISKSSLKVERLAQIGERQIILYPDADGFNQWQQVAQIAKQQGLTVEVSDLIEKHATDEQRANGYDLADYLIEEQNEINEKNKFIDLYNAKLEKVRTDKNLYQDFEIILEEQKAVLVIDGGLSETEAERQITFSENFRKIVLNL